ncbi:hypothetical protein GYMLUDRAFT_90485, partial [Collybiopsis luxurians FD-317 M1]
GTRGRGSGERDRLWLQLFVPHIFFHTLYVNQCYRVGVVRLTFQPLYFCRSYLLSVIATTIYQGGITFFE